MATLYRSGKEIYQAAWSGTRQGVHKLQSDQTHHPLWRLLGSLGLFTAALGTIATATYSERHHALSKGKNRTIGAASILFAIAGVLTSQALISAVLEPAGREVGRTLDQQWLRTHPVNYG